MAMTLDEVVRTCHFAAGSVALATFAIPLVARKGGPLHRRVGWVYASAMWVAAVSAWVTCGFRLRDDDPGNDLGALFLLFVGVLAANAAFVGIRVLRSKGRTGRHGKAVDLAGPLLLLLGSVGMAGLGVQRSALLLVAFAGLGGLLSVGQLRFWLRPPVTRMDWWYEHMVNMLTACIATVTAFLVVNISRLGLQEYSLYVWLAPGVLGGVGISLWERYYRRKFAARGMTEH